MFFILYLFLYIYLYNDDDCKTIDYVYVILQQ